MKERESLSSRLGFILLSAGCAIGIGNIYKFPIMTGYYGGSIFVLFYLVFLVIMGLPIMTMELSTGRASQKSIVFSFNELEKPKAKWHFWKYFAIAGNYLLMMCYTVIVGWIIIYAGKFLTGSITDYKTVDELGGLFGTVVTNYKLQIGVVFAIVIVCFGICALGLKKGVENVTKFLMLALFVILIFIAGYCCFTMKGAGEGLSFYLVPSLESVKEAGFAKTLAAAMNQAFFTLSLGIGSIAIFGSYIKKEKTLVKESITIIALDTAVAILSGFIIFPACFTYAGGVNADGSVGASFIFTSFSSVFVNMGSFGRVLGFLFFVLLAFAALSTVIAVFENIMSFWLDSTKLKRPVVALINIGIMLVAVLPAIFANNIWSGATIFGKDFMTLEDDIVSKILLPCGAAIYCLFCVHGWGYKNYLAETNTGLGLKMPEKKWLKIYLGYVLPAIIMLLLVLGYVL